MFRLFAVHTRSRCRGEPHVQKEVMYDGRRPRFASLFSSPTKLIFLAVDGELPLSVSQLQLEAYAL